MPIVDLTPSDYNEGTVRNTVSTTFYIRVMSIHYEFAMTMICTGNQTKVLGTQLRLSLETTPKRGKTGAKYEKQVESFQIFKVQHIDDKDDDQETMMINDPCVISNLRSAKDGDTIGRIASGMAAPITLQQEATSQHKKIIET